LQWRQTATAAALAGSLVLAACGDGAQVGDSGYVEGFLGGVVSDEPRAALIGREVLSAGGSAADAAVAAYFTLAVTMPGGAGLGGGGVCLVAEPAQDRADVFEFMPGRPADPSARFAIPGNARGMFAVHARYGVLNWSTLLLPAEGLARDGHPISRAFARDLDANAPLLKQHPGTAQTFGVAAGPVAEAAPLKQIPLSAVLSAIRVRGAGDFYQGGSARQFVDAVRQLGGTLTLDDMRDYLPRLQKPLSASSGNDTVYFTGAGGIVAGRIWAMLHDGDRYADADDDGARAHLVAAASGRAYAAAKADTAVTIDAAAGAALIAGFDVGTRAAAAAGDAPPAAPATQNGASIVAVDRFGQVVACGYTMGQPFGAGIMAPGTGILLAPADARTTLSQPAAMAVVNRQSEQLYAAAAQAGGSPAALATLPLDVHERGVALDAAVAAPRLYDPGRPDIVFHEPSLAAAAQARLDALGYRRETVSTLGRINGFHCPDGLPRTSRCQFVNDPRGFGLAASADE
jgi:gamma-glutamyltranspeptidase/glutathione hydrolase